MNEFCFSLSGIRHFISSTRSLLLLTKYHAELAFLRCMTRAQMARTEWEIVNYNG